MAMGDQNLAAILDLFKLGTLPPLQFYVTFNMFFYDSL